MNYAKPFSLDQHGFKVFLEADSLDSSDEYSEEDPYSVEKNLSSAFHRRRFDVTLALIAEAVANEQSPTILDLGCGQGHITQAIKERFPRAMVSGLDRSVSAIRYANENFCGIEFVVGDAMDAPYVAGQFDVVVCNNLYEHVPDPLRLLAGIKAMLRCGGSVIISTPSRYRTPNLLRALLGKPIALMSPYHVTEYTVGQVREQLAYGGFDVTRTLSRYVPSGSLKIRIAHLVLDRVVKLLRSHHQLEATAFYLAHARH